MSQVVPSSILLNAPWRALGVSLVVHLTGLGITAAIVTSPMRTSPEIAGIVQAEIDSVIAEPEPVLLEMGEPSPSAGGGGNPRSRSMMAESTIEPTHRASGYPGLRNLSLSGPISFGDGEGLSYTDVIGEGGTGGGTGGGVGEGHGTGNEPGSGDGFFGMDLAGERFVFVVDASRSMNRPYPGEAKNRLGRDKIELYHTVRKMSPSQCFYVVFFNSEPIPMPIQEMVRADSPLLQKHMEWIFSTRALGQTNPEPALLMALKLQPDKIYFLTDGDFSYRSVRAVREANQGRIPIHTIGFGGREGERNLQEIAHDNRGTYQFIPDPTTDETPNVPVDHATAASQKAP